MSSHLEEAQHFLDIADSTRRLPPPQYGSLAEYERRDRQVLQLHIRAMVSAAASIHEDVERLTRDKT